MISSTLNFGKVDQHVFQKKFYFYPVQAPGPKNKLLKSSRSELGHRPSVDPSADPSVGFLMFSAQII